jgi:hypothetical protein
MTIRKIYLILITISLILGLSLAGSPVAAQGEPVIGKSKATVQFPASITFKLEVRGTANIADVRLHYRLEHDHFARVVAEIKPDFTPSLNVSASWQWDMRQSGGLPTGVVIDYWWTVKDSAGRQANSNTQKVSFDDGNYQWQQLSQGKLTFYWYGVSRSTINSLMAAAQQGLSDLEGKTGATLSQPVRIYVYASTGDMQSAMIFPTEWTGAATYTDLSTIMFGFDSGDLAWDKTTLVHELAHMVSYQMTRNPYNTMPVWLSEGFSTYAEGELELYYRSTLATALNYEDTLSVRSLSSPFSAVSALAYLSYAESYSLVDYLITTYGQASLLAYLTSFQQGRDYDEALQNAYDLDMDGLYRLWLVYATKLYVGKDIKVPA